MPSFRKQLSYLLLAALLGPGPLAQAQNVGIGTSVPTQALDVNGQVRVRGAQGAAGQLLGLADDGTLQVQPPTFSAVAPAFMPTPPVDLGTVPVSPKPQAIVLDPTATRAYVTSQNGSARGQLDAYDLGLDGLPVRRGTVPVGFGPRALVMHPAGIRLYVVNMTDNTLQAFDISGAGLPVSLGVVPTGRGPVAVAVNPAGTRLYVTNSADNRLQTYDITGSGLPVSLGVVRTGRSPVGVVLHPAGTRAYVLQYAPGNLFIYDLNGGGIPIGLVSMGPQDHPTAMALNPASTRAYIATVTNTVHTFDLGGGPRPLAVSAGGAASSLSAAMLPGAGRLPATYGAVSSAGTALGAASGFSVTHPALGVYRLSFTNSPLSTTDLNQAATVVALAGVAPGSVSYRTGRGYLEVLTYAPGGAATDRGFTFSVTLP